MPQIALSPTLYFGPLKGEYLLRYTNLAALLHLLRSRRITLVSPKFWDDKNDRHFIETFRAKQNHGSVVALCFSQSTETYHHWKVFAPGSDGVCIVFKAPQLKEMFTSHVGVRMKEVQYMELKDLSNRAEINVSELPFIKRWPYKPEEEFRVIHVDQRVGLEFVPFEIDLDWIDRIILSPWMPETYLASVADTVVGIPGCEKLRVGGTTLISNSNWKALADRAQ